ncbi:hypothetical protein AMTRI_Chr11g152730 [Amborella trichopoda]|uniref:GIR1-like zinc ribbon domain-containing protein n=1 Tax=Amborella trichopoda TaxID=13333 RepID=U5CSH0_AMBTC|nr:uncharacterized protein LOC18444490 [Amborella trichopoda]ERN16191.1 hypothetical protein AMTR_s00030p00238280 [Amborella trichopoda]|eukprot:XP_020529382.1 uncharacterized protein LOC18444490 [Amborella trichopoda]
MELEGHYYGLEGEHTCINNGFNGDDGAFNSHDQHHHTCDHAKTPITLDLFGSSFSFATVELDKTFSLSCGKKKYCDIKENRIVVGMSKNEKRQGSSPRLELKLTLSPSKEVGERSPSHNGYESSDSGSRSSLLPTSPISSCVSSDTNMAEFEGSGLQYSESPEATSMVLVGCPRCLMYVMLSEQDPKCPKCKSTVLLDFLHDEKRTGK